jgi:hypothetical protein
MSKPKIGVGDSDRAEKEKVTETSFVPIDGRWSFHGTSAIYEGPAQSEGSGEQPRSDGVCLAATRFRSGVLSVTATIDNPASAARLAFGFNAATGEYYSLGINGWYRAYVLARSSRAGPQLIRAEGFSSILTAGKKALEITLDGQRVSLFIDSVWRMPVNS